MEKSSGNLQRPLHLGILLTLLPQGKSYLIWVNNTRFYFGGAPKSLQMVTVVMKLKDTCSLEEKL